MPQGPYQPRQLSEPEFNTIRDRLLNEAPEGLNEQEFHRWIGPRMEQALGEAENQPPALEGSALSRLTSGAGKYLNPIEIAKSAWGGITSELEAGRQAMHEGRPIAGVAHTVASMVPVLGPAVMNAPAGAMQEFQRAGQAGREGRYSQAVGHGLAGLVPVLGPMLGDIGERGAAGDVAGMVGETAGLLAAPKVAKALPAVPGAAVRAATTVAPEMMGRAAGALERGAASRVVDVMAPKIGPNKTRFGGMAEDVAPDIAKDQRMRAWSRQGLHENVGNQLTAAETALDSAADARLKAQSFDTKGIIDDLMAQRRTLVGQPLEASSPIPSVLEVPEGVSPRNRYGDPGFTIPEPGVKQPTRLVKIARPLGREEVFDPNTARVAVIDRAIETLRGLGPKLPYEELRKMRMAYDGPAKAIYHPSVTADFLKAQGGKLGAADVTGTLREHLAKFDPETATANAGYSFWRNANDVMEATAEVERTRPKVGRQIAARMTGALAGTKVAGPMGTVAGWMGGPALEAIMEMGPTTKLRTANTMSRLAQAIRRGDVQQVNSLADQLTKTVGTPPDTPPTGRTPIPSMKPSTGNVFESITERLERLNREQP